MESLFRAIRTGASAVAASMLAVIFAIFLYQIAARYLFGWSVGWTIELNLTLWLWLVLFTCAFVLQERDHVKFDLLFLMAPRPVQKVFAVAAAVAIVAALVAAMPDTWSYVSFYKIKKSATLRWPLNYVFSIYLVFAAVLVLRYAYRTLAILRGHDLTKDERVILAD
jgi:C4-dicarboxylate transporter, DctQ subunit